MIRRWRIDTNDTVSCRNGIFGVIRVAMYSDKSRMRSAAFQPCHYRMYSPLLIGLKSDTENIGLNTRGHTDRRIHVADKWE